MENHHPSKDFYWKSFLKIFFYLILKANFYSGKFKDTDACCRAHDQCPYFIDHFETKYNFHNPYPWTLSHCDCDNKLYSCLKVHAYCSLPYFTKDTLIWNDINSVIKSWYRIKTSLLISGEKGSYNELYFSL